MLKIKVNLDSKSYETLLNDMKLFKIVKKDGTANKNKFMNLLFINYYKEYLNEIKQIIDNTSKLMKKYNINHKEFQQAVAISLFDYKNNSLDTYYNHSLTFYLDDESEFIFETLNSTIATLGASAYFRKLIYRYLENPQYKREEIIFKHIITPILEAIENKEIINVKLEKSQLIIKPYKIGTSKEEIYSYILGISNNNPISLHILKIKAIVSLKTTFNFSTDEIKNLNEIIRLGIQFPFKNICKCEIIFNESGIKLYNTKYLNRPQVVKIENNHYFFECSFDQLLVYFLSFGNNMKIIYPKNLAKAIYKNYKDYVDSYEKDNID